jgi:hypothetical protein
MGEANAVFREEKFQWKGKEVLVKRPTLETEKVFETWLEDKALASIKSRRERGKIREDEYRIELSVFQRDCAAGEYSRNSVTGEKALQNVDGLLAWIGMTLRQSNGGNTFTDGEVRKMWDAQNEELSAKIAAGEVPPNTMPEVMEAMQRVNSPTPTMPPSPSGAKDSA